MGDIRENISKNILFYRKKIGMTQLQLAENIGVKTTSVSSWERGANSPDIETLYSICQLFNVTLDEMYGVEEAHFHIQLSQPEQHHISKYRTLDDKGKHTVDTVLEMEHNRCRTEKSIYLVAESEEQYGVKAAHNDATMTEEEKELMRQDLNEL